MFRKSLMATTALILAASVAFAAHERGVSSPGIHPRYLPEHVIATLLLGRAKNRGVVHNNTSHWVPGAIFNNFSKDKNAEFISWYGFTAFKSTYSYYQSSHYWDIITTAAWNATPFIGNGKAPKSAVIPGFGYASTYRFEVAILSATPSGLPGASVAHTSSTTWSDTSLCCGSARTVKFSNAPKLKKGKQYFVAVECANAPCEGGWNMEDTDFSGAAVDYFRVKIHETFNFGSGTKTYSYSSPTHSGISVPADGAVIIK